MLHDQGGRPGLRESSSQATTGGHSTQSLTPCRYQAVSVRQPGGTHSSFSQSVANRFTQLHIRTIAYK